MPELSRFYGIIIKMLFDDNDKHHKPHVHVYYGEYEASVGLDGEVLDGKIPSKKYRILAGWLVIHEDELYDAWNKAVRNIPFDKIEPLRYNELIRYLKRMQQYSGGKDMVRKLCRNWIEKYPTRKVMVQELSKML